MPRRIARSLLGACIAAVAVMIFLFSSQNGETSSRLSGSLFAIAEPYVRPFYNFLLGHEGTMQELTFLWRKTAHFCEYALLCFLLRFFLHTYPVRFASLTAWGASTLYAMTDELHQMFSDGRSAQLTDVMIDSSGAVTGLIAACILLTAWTWRTKRKKHVTKQ